MAAACAVAPGNAGPEVTHTAPILRFFSITFGVTWICWGVSYWLRAHGGTVPGVIAGVLFYLGVFAPGLVAIALTDRGEGRSATRALLGRILRFEVGARWYVFAVGFFPAVKLSVALVFRLATGAWPRFGDEPWALMAAAILISTWVQAGEEVGWRGYALPRLSARVGLGPGSLLLGIIWAGWHLPLFFVPESNTFQQSFPLYVMQVTGLSVVMAWLFWRTGGSLLLVMILHAAVNNTKDIVPSVVPGATDPFALSTSLVAWLTLAFVWIAAVYCLVRMRGVRTLAGDAA